MKGGLIPHLTKKGHFWKSTPPAIHTTVLKYRLYIDPVNSAHLKQVEQIECGWVAPLPKKSHYDAATGLHYTLGPVSALQGAQYWMNQDVTTAKAASLAVPPMSWNSSVQRLTQHFEHMSMRNAGHVADFGSLLDDPTAEASQIQLKHGKLLDNAVSSLRCRRKLFYQLSFSCADLRLREHRQLFLRVIPLRFQFGEDIGDCY